MQPHCSLYIIGALLSAPYVAASAQGTNTAHGSWVWVGLGYGSAGFSCDSCRAHSRLGGWTNSVDFGYMPNPHVQVGGAMGLWFNGLKSGSKLPAIANVAAVAAYHPRVRGGPFLEGQIGLSAYELGQGKGDPLEPFAHDTGYGSGGSLGLALGVGWEFGAGPGHATARVMYTDASLGRLDNNGTTVATNWRQNLLVVELGWRGRGASRRSAS